MKERNGAVRQYMWGKIGIPRGITSQATSLPKWFRDNVISAQSALIINHFPKSDTKMAISENFLLQ